MKSDATEPGARDSCLRGFIMSGLLDADRSETRLQRGPKQDRRYTALDQLWSRKSAGDGFQIF